MSTTAPANSAKAILFLGATGGVALATLRRSLAANHTCIALCRNPATLTALLSGEAKDSNSSNNENTALPSNLTIVQGNAHSASTLASSCLRHPSDPSRLVDVIVFSIGARPSLRGLDDPHVCEKGMAALLEALRTLRQGEDRPRGKPRLVAISSTGVGTLGREVPWPMVPMYKAVLGAAHRDKKAMERLVVEAGKDGDKEGEEALVSWTIVRGSLYTSGPATEGKVRVGWEDPVARTRGNVPVGYTISREDVGKWVFENCVQGGEEWVGRVAVLTY